MKEPQRFQLEVRVEVRQVLPHGGWTNNALTVQHTVELGTLDFLELAAVLGRFHELGEKIRTERANFVQSLNEKHGE